MNKGIIGSVVVAILVVVLVYYSFNMLNLQSNNNLLVTLTDPPVVPAGTQALYINYSSVTVLYLNHNNSGVATSNAAGEINLMSLTNSSIVLANFNIPNGSSIQSVRFNVSSASIIINNVSYPVFLPSNQITVNHISAGSSFVNGSLVLLLDLSPTVVSIQTKNNSNIFILVPSVKAISVGGKSISIPNKIGARASINREERDDLEASNANISITNASIVVNGNLTSLKLTVLDNSNSSVIIKHVLLFGSSTIFSNSQHDNGDKRAIVPEGEQRNITPPINVTNPINITHPVNISNNNSLQSIEKDRNDLEGEGRVINFFVSQNGSLYLPFNDNNEQEPGFLLNPGKSVTFTFSGEIFAGESHVLVSLLKGSSYIIVVQGEDGARASVNTTAV